jgi:malonate-semialdehyde dehydrogenase (acetylating)/methylmalonate-semialdehyde dehydrogenase
LTEPADAVGHFINGAVVPDDNRPLPVTNPATGNVIRHVAMASQATVEEAIAVAQAAFPAWRNIPPVKRARVMFRFKRLLEEHADEIVALLTEEHGKVLDDAMGEFQRGIEFVDYACGVAELLKGEHSRNVGPGIDSWSEFQPHGVVAGITPFNFPAMVPMWMFPMAIACGNTFVLKPSEKDPSAPMFVAQLLSEAGLPDGVYNVVNGDKEAVDTLLTDERVKAISFVGSTPIAEYIYATGTSNGKRVQALGGAKNHAVIMPDADIQNAVSALMGAAYGSCGERCMAISVAVCIGDEIADAVVDKLTTELADLKVGCGTDTSNNMGPLVTRAHHDKVRSYVDLGVEEGAELVVDGRAWSAPSRSNMPWNSSTITSMATARVFSRAMAKPHVISPTTSTWGWSASTYRYRCPSRFTASAAGSDRCSETCTRMAPTVYASTPTAKR